ncbi:hypothetical protein Tco_0869118 [Tanacetum coccineum]
MNDLCAAYAKISMLASILATGAKEIIQNLFLSSGVTPLTTERDLFRMSMFSSSCCCLITISNVRGFLLSEKRKLKQNPYIQAFEMRSSSCMEDRSWNFLVKTGREGSSDTCLEGDLSPLNHEELLRVDAEHVVVFRARHPSSPLESEELEVLEHPEQFLEQEDGGTKDCVLYDFCILEDPGGINVDAYNHDWLEVARAMRQIGGFAEAIRGDCLV